MISKFFFSDFRSYSGQSENGEDGIVRQIFNELNRACSYCIEFGAGDGKHLSITYPFRLAGSKSLLMDGAVEITEHANRHKAKADGKTSADVSVERILRSHSVKNEFITAENINDLFRKFLVPDDTSLLVIDIDGNEYHVWNSIEIKPDIVVIEYNPYIRPDIKCTIPYNPNFKTKVKSKFCSASCLAFAQLGKKKGYTLVEVDKINMFFVANELTSNLKTARWLYNDWLFLYLKNLIEEQNFTKIRTMNPIDQLKALRNLKNTVINMFNEGDSRLWTYLPYPDAHLYGDWLMLP